MKHILLLAVMLTLLFGSTAARIVKDSGISSNAADVEGVILNRQKAQAKPGYQFARRSSNSVTVLKVAGGVAAIQTGTLTCTGKGKTCEVYVSPREAQCNGGCYFVGVRGAERVQ